MSGEGEVSMSDSDRSVQAGVRSYINSGKENLNIFGGNFADNLNKSPLPVGYPRRPLNDITAVLQSLEDEPEAVCKKPRKPFTRSQNVGTCSQRYELIETSRQALKKSWSSNQGKESSDLQFATKAAMKKKSSTRCTVSSSQLTHNQENRESITDSLSKKKAKTVTFVEAETSGTNANQTVLVSAMSSCSNNVTSAEDLSRSSGVSGAEAGNTGIRDEGPVNTAPSDQREPKSNDAPSTDSTPEANQAVQDTPAEVSPAEAKDACVRSSRRNELSREHKKQKTATLASRSSVARFR